MANREIIQEIENVILQWSEASIGSGDFGAITFLYRGEEFGHIHQNRDLDISFTKPITVKLREKNLVKKHLYVPETSITFYVSSPEKLPFAISLLRFSYLIHFIKRNANETISSSVFELELAKLPESLSSLYLSQA
ncbi:hypothetical protein GCM10028807_32210 [Spirosoma daeguense]